MKLLTILISLVLGSAGLAADFDKDKLSNWHQWRGPHATGTAPLGDPPSEWSESKNIQWKIPVPGNGSSTPIIWKDRVYLVTAVKTDKVDPKLPAAKDQPRRPFGIRFANHFHRFVVLSLDRDTGKVVWRKTALEAVPFQGHHPDNNFASPSPTTDGKRLYVWLGSQGLYCYDLAGNRLWKRDLGPAKTRLSFGEGASPVVHQDRVVIIRDTEDQSYVMCLNAASGKTL